MTEYGKALMKNATIRKLRQKAESGKITAKEMNRLAEEYGKVAGECISQQLLEAFPNGQALEEDVLRIINPILRENHQLISDSSRMMLDAQYQASGTGLKAVIPDYNAARVNEIAKEISLRSFKDGGMG